MAQEVLDEMGDFGTNTWLAYQFPPWVLQVVAFVFRQDLSGLGAQGFPRSNPLTPSFQYLGFPLPKGILKNYAPVHTLKLTSKKCAIVSLNICKGENFPLLSKLTIFV